MTVNPGSFVPYPKQLGRPMIAPKRRLGGIALAAFVVAAVFGSGAAAQASPAEPHTPNTTIDHRSGLVGAAGTVTVPGGSRVAQPLAPLASGTAAKITLWAGPSGGESLTLALHAMSNGVVDPEPLPGGTGQTVSLPTTVAPQMSPGADGVTVPGPEVGDQYLPRQVSFPDGPELTAGAAYAIVITVGGEAGVPVTLPATASELAGAGALLSPAGAWEEAPGPVRLLYELQLWEGSDVPAPEETPHPGNDAGGTAPPADPVVIPTAPALRCADRPALDLPRVTGVRYGQERSGDALLAQATPEPGFAFPEGTKTSWRFLLSVCDRGAVDTGAELDGGDSDGESAEPSGTGHNTPRPGTAGPEDGAQSPKPPVPTGGNPDGESGGDSSDPTPDAGNADGTAEPNGPGWLQRTGGPQLALLGGLGAVILLAGSALSLRARRHKRS